MDYQLWSWHSFLLLTISHKPYLLSATAQASPNQGTAAGGECSAWCLSVPVQPNWNMSYYGQKEIELLWANLIYFDSLVGCFELFSHDPGLQWYFLSPLPIHHLNCVNVKHHQLIHTSYIQHSAVLWKYFKFDHQRSPTLTLTLPNCRFSPIIRLRLTND